MQSESQEVPMMQGCYVIPLLIKKYLLGTQFLTVIDLGKHGKIPLVTAEDSFSEARLVDKGFPRRYVRQKGEVL